ncbi:MAG TPA: PEPxxWA-CTERM sorting domain-containing protein [Sphingobium sp.]|nr:PEPxxWA-CTERM sorting domain-containing protein [Sphingobium sp.]
MRKSLVSVGVAAVALIAAVPASAAVLWDFGQDGSVNDLVGFTLLNNFNADSGISSGANYQIKTNPSDSDGAVLPNGDGSEYLSVLGGGFATIDFAPGVTEFAFEWGSIDTYNSLTVLFNNGESLTIVPGGNFTNPANGNQFDADTNGLFRVFGSAGETFNSITFASGSNSFEVDNLMVKGAVPEPATWAMMIGGLALVGASMRRRKVEISFA